VATNKNGLNKSRHVNIKIVIVMLLFGFYGQFVFIDQSEATIIKDTLNIPSYAFINKTINRIVSNNENNITQSFHTSYEVLINYSRSLTESYQREIGKWQSRQYDTKAMISITDKYLPEFQKLVKRAQALRPTTEKYLQAKDLYIKSLTSEIGSYIHFQNFLVTGKRTEDDTSTRLLSNALKFEIESFAAFNNRTVSDTENNYGNRSFLPV
jgi:hypothetical protein